MYAFLTADNYIEHNIQKGFTPATRLELSNIQHKWQGSSTRLAANNVLLSSNYKILRMAFILVRQGVLQGACLSPLLFNMCFNTFAQHIEVEKYQQFGFSFKLMNPAHWFQFADDAAVITAQESENHNLLYSFSIWRQWSNMFIRVEKCSTFGIKIQHKICPVPSKLLINSALIP